MSLRSLLPICSLAFFCLAVMFSGCPSGEVKDDPKTVAFAKPSLEFSGIAFENRSFSGTDTVFKFTMLSQDSRPTRVLDCPYSLKLENGDAITGSVQPGEQLAGKGKLEVLVRVAIPWPTQRAEVQEFLARERWPYNFSLSCKLESPSGEMLVSNTDVGSIPLPKLPKMDVVQANAERFGSGDEKRVNFELSMLNENTFKLKLDKIAYKVFLGDIQVTEGDLVLAEIIPPSAEFTYDVATPIFNSQEHKEVLELLAQPQIEYRLEGNILLSGFELPLKAQGTINFTRPASE